MDGQSVRASKIAVILVARVGEKGHPTCSRTGSGQTLLAAFADAETKLSRGLRVPKELRGQVIAVVARKQGCNERVGNGSAPELTAAMDAARRSLLEVMEDSRKRVNSTDERMMHEPPR